MCTRADPVLLTCFVCSEMFLGPAGDDFKFQPKVCLMLPIVSFRADPGPLA